MRSGDTLTTKTGPQIEKERENYMKNWLNDAVVYEIYPQSFYDSNGDGIGDLRGIIEKLDYIKDLGFTAVWMNPINASSFRDAGYDVTDYYTVAPRYGTNDDYKALCDEAHKRGMKVIFDLVPGHTSVDHPWFKESAKAEKNEYSNRYIWTNGTFDEGPGMAALGDRDAKVILNFFWSQPALNYGYADPNPAHPWELPVDHPDCVAMRKELMKIIDFWTDLGTDAFRVDMAAHLIKNDFTKEKTSELWHDVRRHIEERNPEVLMIAEWAFPEEAVRCGFHLDFLLHSGPTAYRSLFRYELGRNTTNDFIGHSYFSREGKGNVNEYLDRYLFDLENTRGKGYIGMITGNHDMQRLAYLRDPEEIKAAFVFLFTMPGVPFVYYGDEIGMDYIKGLPSKEGGYIRTGCRTPMQWNHQKNHGFSTSDEPYLPTDQREGAPTVEDQINDPDSILNFVKKLIKVHRDHPAFHAEGDLNILLPSYPFVFERSAEGRKYLIAINPSDQKRYFDAPARADVLLEQNVAFEGDRLVLGPVSFIVFEEK